MMARLATGKKVIPHFTKDTKNFSALDISDNNREQILNLMRAVVMPGGTLSRYNVSGLNLAGKTGTAQVCSLRKGERGKSIDHIPFERRDHGWSSMVCCGNTKTNRFQNINEKQCNNNNDHKSQYDNEDHNNQEKNDDQNDENNCAKFTSEKQEGAAAGVYDLQFDSVSVVAIVEHSGFGGRAAGPIVKKALQYIYKKDQYKKKEK